MALIKESEKVIERRLVKGVKDKGGLALKFPATQFAGIPDRICLLPGARIDWVELKSTGVKPTKLQLIVHERLRALGFTVLVIDSTAGVDEYLAAL
jgi:hypothetical protein